jgi:hypothetical protein
VQPTAGDRVLAATHGKDEVDHLTTAFFSHPPASHPHEAWDDTPLPPMTHGARRAMLATLVILASSFLLLCGYVGYVRLVMPVPVELGRGSSVPARVAIAAVPSAPIAIAAPTSPHVAAVVPPAPPVAPTAPSSPLSVVAAAPTVPAPTPAIAPAVVDSAQGQSDAALVASLAAAGRLYEHGQRKQARAAYEQALLRDPNASEALSKLAYLHLDAGDNDQARQFAGRAIAVSPNDSQAWIVLGAARSALGDRKGAREAYRACAALPHDAYTAECRRLAR